MAIFGGDQRRGRPVGKFRNFEKKTFIKKNIIPLPRPQPDLRGGGQGVYPTEFSISSGVNCGAAEALGSTIKNLSPIY